ncbi:MAG: zf-HC2 domain-containing protein [Spirochaetes bacterium]|nr:zf-HC2 domain-containing protein [Spirochaetota bacterium]
MTFKHLKFEELSDLIDNVLVEEEREYYLAHLSQCKDCKKEYESLLKSISLISSLNKENLAFPDFSQSTIIIYKSREKKKLLFKVIPAIAASVIMVVGIGFVKVGTFNKSSSNLSGKLTANYDAQRITEDIDSLKGKIVHVNQSYIDTELDKGMLTKAENLLNNKNIKHAIIINPAISRNPLEKIVDDVSSSGIKRTIIKDYDFIPLENKQIRIRIFNYSNLKTE